MDLALCEAEAAAARDEVPVGAVLIGPEAEIVARAGNRMRELNDPTAHAEMLVVRSAAATLGSQRLLDCTLYVTLEPCPMCAYAISLARLRRLCYAAGDPKCGAVEHGPRLYASPATLHRPEVCGGIGEHRAAALLRAFFQARR
jgi:tRNA(Arg) A34 adenosine deaminase TadA